MRFTTVLSFFLFTFLSYTQNQHQGIIIDSDDNEPIEFVGIYNEEDHTLTNADGQFLFSSNKDSVYLYRMGYEKVKTTFAQLQDTIFLKKSRFELDEVVVTNAKTLWQRVKDSIKSNYRFEPYKEKFLLRAILKYNDTITRIQDVQGKLERKTLLYPNGMELTKKDYQVEFTNMRKIGVVKDEHNVYFKFPSLYGLLSSFVRMNATGEGFILTENYFDNGDKIKYEFKSEPHLETVHISGYYIINAEDYAIEEFHLKATPKNPPYTEKKWLKYRTLRYELIVLFEKHPTAGSYFIGTAKSNEVVEIMDKEESFKENYDMSFVFATSDNFGNFKVKKNVNATKDIFRLKYPYDETYWKSQNQLLLTKDMLKFIKKAGAANKEFKIRSNIK